MRRWLMFVSVCLSLASLGCGGGGEEPTEIPKSPPKGKSLPRFALEPRPVERRVQDSLHDLPRDRPA